MRSTDEIVGRKKLNSQLLKIEVKWRMSHSDADPDPQSLLVWSESQ
jgi:hypothetical protein